MRPPPVALALQTPIVDFVAGTAAHRRHYGGGQGQRLAKAIGIKPRLFPSVLDLTALTENQEALFRLLLELNNTLMHCAYAIQDDRVVLSGAQPLENLDQNEFQAVVDDMAVALDSHQAALAPWSFALAADPRLLR